MPQSKSIGTMGKDKQKQLESLNTQQNRNVNQNKFIAKNTKNLNFRISGKKQNNTSLTVKYI